MSLALAATLLLTLATAPSHVIDTAGVLSRSDRRDLESQLARLQQSKNVEIVVYTLPGLEGASAEGKSRDLANRMSVGSDTGGRGALVAFFQADRQVYIQLSDNMPGGSSFTKGVIDDVMVPAFRNGDYAGGFSRGAERLAGGSGGVASKLGCSGRTKGGLGETGFILLVVAIVLLRWFFGGGGYGFSSSGHHHHHHGFFGGGSSGRSGGGFSGRGAGGSW